MGLVIWPTVLVGTIEMPPNTMAKNQKDQQDGVRQPDWSASRANR